MQRRRRIGLWAVTWLSFTAGHAALAQQPEAVTPAPDADTAPAPPPAPAPAPQPEIVVDEPLYAASVSYVETPASKLSKTIVLPSGVLEAGAELALLTSDAMPAGDALALTDLGLLRLRARKGWNAWFETYAATQLLAKQPAWSDEALWQGALLGARAAFAEHFAGSLQGDVGPLLEGGGWYFSAAPGLLAKAVIDYEVRFEVGVGYAYTQLERDAAEQPSFRLHEAVAHAEAQLGGRQGGFWARLDYRVPFGSEPDRDAVPAGEAYLDPTVQLGLQVGGVMAAGQGSDWNVFAYGAIVDRGDAGVPGTTLPILDGGFDQHQWVLGVQHRFGAGDQHRSAGRAQ